MLSNSGTKGLHTMRTQLEELKETGGWFHSPWSTRTKKNRPGTYGFTTLSSARGLLQVVVFADKHVSKDPMFESQKLDAISAAHITCQSARPFGPTLRHGDSKVLATIVFHTTKPLDRK